MSEEIDLFRYSSGVKELIGKKIKSVFFSNPFGAIMIVTDDMQLFKIKAKIGYDDEIEMFFHSTDDDDVKYNLHQLLDEGLISLEQQNQIINHYKDKQKKENEKKKAELAEQEYQQYLILKAKFEPQGDV